MLIDSLDSIPEIFTDGVRAILLLLRGKDGEVGNAQRKAIKRISRDPIEWKSSVLGLLLLQKSSHLGYRIYSSINSRDMSKAVREFKRRQLDADYDCLSALHSFYCDVENRFFSCLMNPISRSQSHFLIDCDSQEEYERARLQLHGTGLVLFQYQTKNGWHIITQPFNPNGYGNMQIKKDELMFIG